MQTSQQTDGPIRPISPSTDAEIDLVVIAASAGGLHAVSTILAALPTDFPAAIAVVQHRPPDDEVHLYEQLIANKTPLPVQTAQQGDRLQTGSVYVAPPDHHMQVTEQGGLTLAHTAKVGYARPAADPLFASAATHIKGRLIAVILTGGNSDGADGIKAIKQAGGTVIAQDPATAEATGMPRSAIATGAVDFILPLAEIGPTLLALLQMSREQQA